MLAQIQAFAATITPANIDPALVVSKALTLTQGTIASGASRYDADTIAKYEFQTGREQHDLSIPAASIRRRI